MIRTPKMLYREASDSNTRLETRTTPLLQLHSCRPHSLRTVISRPTSFLSPPEAGPNTRTVLPPAGQQHHGDVRNRHQGGHDTVDDLAGAGVVRELQTEAAVDDAEGNQGAAEPDVHGGPKGAA